MTSNNPSQLSPWLNTDLIQNILRSSENDKTINVQRITSKDGTTGGDNYSSDISRVYIELTRGQTNHEVVENKTLIFKVSLKKDSSADLGLESNNFEIESLMMQNTLVKMNEILNEKNYRLNARAFHVQLGDPSFLVLEDLVAQGFRMGNRYVGLDYHHCIAVMRGMAKFHASSVALYEKDPNSINLYRKGIYYEECPEKIKSFIADGFKILSNEIKNWSDLDPSYSEIMMKLSESCFNKGVKCSQPKENEFNVINHNDTWVNNLMFRYDDEGKVIDQIFLDFQLPLWSSPAIDLLYFLSTSPNDDVHSHNYDGLIAEYSNTLTQTMLRINCKTKPPTLDSILKCFKEREFLVVLHSIMSLPYVLVNKEEVISLSELLNPETGAVCAGYKDTRYRQIMIKRLKDWNSRGLLDV